MTTALRIITCGPGASLQDLGRFGLQRYGVSPAGAMEPEALARANALVGNGLDSAGLELMLAGAVLTVETGPVLITVSGGGASLAVAGRSVPSATSAVAHPGETVTVGPCRNGVYAYIAVAGGFARPSELGSLSLHRRSGLGGTPLGPDDVLPVGHAPHPLRPSRLHHEAPADPSPIRIMHGPQSDHFTPEALDTLTSSAFRVGFASDRMGVRLEGPVLPHSKGYNIVSDGIVTGSIQVPGNGQPIVLMRDRQTTGGYPKIATVISADLGRFAQVQPGGEVHFAAVTREEAVAAAKQYRDRINSLLSDVMPAEIALTTELLLRENLISGVTG